MIKGENSTIALETVMESHIFTVLNYFSLLLEAEIQSVEGVGGGITARYKVVTFYPYKEVHYMGVLLYLIYEKVTEIYTENRVRIVRLECVS